MPGISTRSFKSAPAKYVAPAFDLSAMIPVLACAYSTIIGPLLYFFFPPSPGLAGLMETRVENRFCWPTLAAISIILAVRRWPRGGSRLTLPPNVVALLAYLAFAGASVGWAFKPDMSFVRFTQEVMILTS